MAKSRATAEEIQTQIATLMAEADQLKAKADSEEGLTPEEQARLEEIVAQIEQLQSDLDAANTEQRMVAVKERMHAPTRPAPTFNKKVYATPKTSFGEGFGLWALSRSSEGDNSPEAAYKARAAGFNLGSQSVKVPANWNKLAYKNRAILSKGGVGTGAELVYQTYSDKVVEYLTLSSPILGLVASETTSDGNKRTYFKIDDTAMEATYTSASGGTETNPTIPQTNLATGNVIISCFDLTSGVQQISFNSLRDSAINLEDKIAQASANSFARKMEREILSATGNGETGVQGISQVATALAGVASWSIAALEGLYFRFPAQYRANAIFVVNPDAHGDLYTSLKNDIGDSYFGRTVDQGVEWDTLMGKKVVVSRFVPDNTVYMFDPSMYQLRLVEGQVFQRFDEVYWPNIGWGSVMSFGGAYIGDPAACLSLEADTGSTS